MTPPTKYQSIQELKSSSRPADPSSDRPVQRHDSFERSMRFLREKFVKASSKQE